MLEARGVSLTPDDMEARVEGVNRVRNRVPVLEEVLVHYTLRVPAGSRQTVEEALERHVSRCPTARSLEGAVAVRWTADIQEREA